MRMYAIVNTQTVIWHRWPDAPPHRYYLSLEHRHKLDIRVELEVFHNDREVEYHDLLDFLEGKIPSGDIGWESCEMVAQGIVEAIQDEYPGRVVMVTVMEDGENGARVVGWPKKAGE